MILVLITCGTGSRFINTSLQFSVLNAVECCGLAGHLAQALTNSNWATATRYLQSQRHRTSWLLGFSTCVPEQLQIPYSFFLFNLQSSFLLSHTWIFSRLCIYLPSYAIATAKFRPLSVSCSSVLLSLVSLLANSLFHCYQKYFSKIDLKASLSCL